MPRNQHYWVCKKCLEEQFTKDDGDGQRLCGLCSGDVDRRKIAVRLLIAKGSTYYVEGFGTVHNDEEHAAQQVLVDELAAKLKSGDVPTPDELPMPIKLGRPGTVSDHIPRVAIASGSVRQGRRGTVVG